MALPLFGQQGGVSRKQAPSLLETEHAASDAELLESARAALRDLCDGGARALDGFGASLLGARSVEADRPTMDAAARDAHDAALRALVFALAPVGGRFEAHVILDYLARTADLLEACPADVLRLLAPHCAASPSAARVFCRCALASPRLPRKWAFAVPAAKGAERAAVADARPVSLPPALFGNACAADAAFAEDVAGHAVACAGAAADAVEALTNGAAADLPLTFAPIFAFAARALSRAAARGRDGKLARRLLPKVSALLDTKGPCAPDARACAEAVLLALCGQGSLSDDASDAAAASVIDASLRTGALEKRSLAVALTVAASKSCRARGAAGALPRAALLNVVSAPNVEAVARSLEGDAAAKVLCPQLADLAASDDGDAAFRVLETAFLGAGAPHAALALRSVAHRQATPRVAAVVAAAARACGSAVLAGVLADDARLGALLEGDRSPALAAVRIVHGCADVEAAVRDLAAAPGDDAASALAALAAGPGAWDHLRLVFGHTSLVEALETAPCEPLDDALRTLATAAPPPDLAAAFYGGLLARADLRRRAGDASWLDLAAPALRDGAPPLEVAGRARHAPPLVLALAAGDGALIAEALAAPGLAGDVARRIGPGPDGRTWARAVDAYVGNAADAADAAAVAAPRLVDLAADDATVGEIADRCLRALAAAPGRRALAQEWGLRRLANRGDLAAGVDATAAALGVDGPVGVVAYVAAHPAPPAGAAAAALGALGDAAAKKRADAKPQTPDAAVPALVACLASADGDLRAAAAETCAQLQGSPARTALATFARGRRAALAADGRTLGRALGAALVEDADGPLAAAVYASIAAPFDGRGGDAALAAAVAAALGDRLAWSDGALGPALRSALGVNDDDDDAPKKKKARGTKLGAKVAPKAAPAVAAAAPFGAARAASCLAASFLAAKLGGGDGGDDDGAAARVCLAALGAAGAEAPAGDDYARQAWAAAPAPSARAVVLGALAGAPEPALRRCFSDAERTQLFAALLALLRRDGAALAEDRSSALAAVAAVAPKSAWPRAWAAALRRPGVAGLEGDCAALLEASEAPGARDGGWLRPLFAAAKKLRAAAAWATLRAVLAAARGLLEGDGAPSIAAADVAGDVAFLVDAAAADDGGAREGAARTLALVVEADAAAAGAHWARALGAARGSSVGARVAAAVAAAALDGGAAPAALFDAALAPAEADDDPSLLRAVADALGSAGPAAVALACLARRRPRTADRVLERGDADDQVKALGHVARSCRPLLVAARADEAFDGAESGAFLEPCFAAGAAAAPVAVRDVARSPGAALSLVAVAAGFVRKRVLKLSHEPELAAGRHRGRKRRRNGARPPPRNGGDADRLAAQRFRLVLCQELSGGLGLVPGDPARDDDDAARPRAFSTASRPDDDDAWPPGEAPCGARHFAHAGRALGRALKRALGLLDAPGLLSFVEKVLARPCPTRARDATTRALDERLDRERPLFRAREPGGPPAATPFARVLLEETLPSLARAVAGDVEHPLEDTADARHASLVAAKMADVLARALAESCRGDDGARFEVLVEAACAALPPACDGAAVEAYGPERPAAVFALVQTLLATLRDAALPALGAGLPRCLDAVDAVLAVAAADARAARRLGSLRAAALRTVLVVAATVPRFAHAQLPRLLRIAVDAAAAGDDGAREPYELAAAPRPAARDEPEADPRAALRTAEAEAGRKIADALARGVEPRVLLPAVVAAHAAAAAAGGPAAAAALRVALPCVARMGRGAAKAHAATVASLALGAVDHRGRLGGAVQGAVDAAATELSLALLSKLGDAELVDWLRAAAAWAAAAPDAAAPDAVLRPAPATDDEAAARRSAFYYQVATLAGRFREIAAPRCLDACYDQCVRDMACPADARAGEKKRKRADAVDAAARRLLSYRALGCVAAVVGHLGERLAGDRFDAALEPLSAALTYDAAVWAAPPAFAAFVAAAAAPAAAALGDAVGDPARRRDLALRLMLLARDGDGPTRRAALAAVRSLCDALREDAADFANQLVQGVAECLDDPECAPDARALVLLVESHTGIRLV